MKNIIITSQQLKRELVIWLLCLVAAVGLNVYAILIYSTSWHELYTKAGYVIVLSFFIYGVLWLLRGLLLLIRYLVRKRSKS
ncbi:hypothetical protein ACT29H_13580 [Thermophagus sp. OGC60D27]|uniref:hypothetical protein n=1 Tax=Thermophagus sp. OGC60D27 TaxID=3458415 RepID=UPI004037EE7F